MTRPYACRTCGRQSYRKRCPKGHLCRQVAPVIRPWLIEPMPWTVRLCGPRRDKTVGHFASEDEARADARRRNAESLREHGLPGPVFYVERGRV